MHDSTHPALPSLTQLSSAILYFCINTTCSHFERNCMDRRCINIINNPVIIFASILVVLSDIYAKAKTPPPTLLTSSHRGGRRGSTTPVPGERVSPRHPGIVVDVNRHELVLPPSRRASSMPHRFRCHPFRTAAAAVTAAEIFLADFRLDLHWSWLRGELIRACTPAAAVDGHGCCSPSTTATPLLLILIVE